jgi:hypothetical protein
MKRFKGTSPKDVFQTLENAFEEGEPWAKKVVDFIVAVQQADFGDL